MAQTQPDITAILAALAAQRPAAQAPPQPLPVAGYPGVVSAATPSNPLAGIALPQPSNSGSLDLSAIKPTNTGSVSLADAIAKARGIAEKANPAREDPRLAGRAYGRRSRSRSPPRRENFRDGFNPYRDERRDDSRRGTNGRERSFSPGPQYQPQAVPLNYPPQNTGMMQQQGGGDSGSEVITVDSSSVGLIIGRGGENLRRVEGETGARVQFITGPDSNSAQRQCRISGSAKQRADAKREIFRVAEENPKSGVSSAPLAGAAGRNQAAAGLPPLREGEKSLQIMVPDRTVGLIIGRGGETIRDLQERSGCHVNIVGETKSINGLRPVNLIGTHASAMKAKELILEVVESDTRAGPNAVQSRDHGRGGYDPYAAPPPVAAAPYGQYMYGAPAPAPALPMGGGGGGGGGDRISETIQVPSEAVGMIIGKGGETIKDMQNTTGCKINVSPPAGGADIQRDIGLVGSYNAIESAKRAIWDKVGSVREKQGGRRGPPEPVSYGDPYAQHAQHAPSYGQPAPAPMPQHPMPSAVGPEPTSADPYAAYGGYQNYMAMWYAALANQGQQPGGPPPA